MNPVFKAWQNLECARLNISLEQHNKLIKLANATAAAMDIPLGVAYENLVAAIVINPPNKPLPLVRTDQH